MAGDIYSKAGADAAFVHDTSAGRQALAQSPEITSTIGAVGGEKFAPIFGWAIATDPRWGIMGDGVTDDSAAINAMLQEVYRSAKGDFGGGVAYFPAGTYICEDIQLRSRVTIKGAGKRATRFKAKAGGTASSVFSLRPGPVQSSVLEDFEVMGNGNAGQHGIRLTATLGTFSSGGWWESAMRRVRVSGFAGHQIWLEGGVGGFLPHQFLAFEHVEAFSLGGLHALHVTGQTGQVSYTACQFDGDGIVVADGEDGASVYIGSLSYSHTFINTTFQENLYGIILDGPSPVTLLGCYWENIGRAALAKGGTRLLRVIAPSISNGAHVSDNSGYIFRAEAASFLVWDSVKAGGTVDRVQSTDTTSVISGSSYLGPTQPGAGSTGVTKNIAESGGVITLNTAATTFLVNGSANTIVTISGTFRSPGEQVRIKAHGGSIVLGQTGNISVGKVSGTLTVPTDAWVTLCRVDSGGKDWVVVGMSPA
ncbi:glycosyl hydrolase family 28-related protein [Microbacterium sp. 16-032]|uniref:glycosyl hydrolase family 28-related protein n=1 Tax=Microbacterium sp. 16-032 TaxID=3239808 RepID=UPI0034E232FE